jgi:hypothetical protein
LPYIHTFAKLMQRLFPAFSIIINI